MMWATISALSDGDREYLEPELVDLIRRADLILLMLDLQTHPDQQLDRTIEILKQNRVIPLHKKDEFAEPFRAIYKKTCLNPIKISLEVGKLRVNSFFDQLNIRFVDWSEIEQFDPKGVSFFNINTPEDLEQAQQRFDF